MFQTSIFIPKSVEYIFIKIKNERVKLNIYRQFHSKRM